MSRYLLSFALLGVSHWAEAIEGTRPAYTPPPPAVSSGNVMQIVLSLLLVIAAIVLVAWLLKRMNALQTGDGQALKVLSSVAIGQRERIVLIEVEETWLVVGVGPGQIRTLHTLPRASLPAQNNTVAPEKNFNVWLKKVIEKRNAT